jgi:hypothetical protein
MNNYKDGPEMFSELESEETGAMLNERGKQTFIFIYKKN